MNEADTRPIPPDRQGYAVDRWTGVVHTRYADHAPFADRTRTTLGLQNLLEGRPGEPCELCYPPASAAEPSTPKRRAAPRRPRPAQEAAAPVEAAPPPEPKPDPEPDVALGFEASAGESDE